MAAAPVAAAPVAAAMAARIEAGHRPDLVMAVSDGDGRDVLGRLSARIDRPVVTNAVGVVVERHRVVVDTVFAGDTRVRTAFISEPPHLVAFRPRSFTAAPVSMSSERRGAGPPEIVPVVVGPLGPAGAVRVLERHVGQPPGPDLDGANVVVAGGRGLGSPENFGRVEELARLLHGAPAASRPAVDAGWAPYSWLVGQTGRVVKPTVYLAFGISGASQHTAGMAGAGHLIAVNRDRQAPMLAMADLGIVGDANRVLAELIAVLRARRR